MPTNGLTDVATDILATYADTLGGSDHTKKNCLIYASAFLRYAKVGHVDELQRAPVQGFLAALGDDSGINPLPRGKPASQGTKSFAWRIVRRMFVTNGVEWPFRKGEGPMVRSRDQRRIMLGPRAIEGAIQAVRQAGQAQVVAWLALSTTYGMRMSEIAGVRPDHIDLERKTLHVETLKHGRERTHAIPDVLVPALSGYGFSDNSSASAMHQAWLGIEEMIGLEHTPGVGWHSIRRALVTMLEDRLPLAVVRRFLRWKAGEDQDMAQRYNTVQVVDLGGESYYTADEGELAEDQRVFESHPFLEMWR